VPPVAIPGYAPLPVPPPAIIGKLGMSQRRTMGGCLPRSRIFRSALSSPIPRLSLPALTEVQTTAVAVAPAPLSAGIPTALQCQGQPVLSYIEKDRVNKRRKEQRVQERPYFKEMVNAHSEQWQPRFPIPTDADGRVIGLKTKWHNSVRSIAKTILRWDIQNYREHPTEWSWVLNTLTRELSTLYEYLPFELSRSYLSKYLGGTISDDRKEWKCYYFQTGLQHENMPDAAFKAWQLWWVSEEGMLKYAQMKKLRAQKKPQ
jgi:hypothetical protein